ncbi:DUF411 domain-containing protein [Undibacterium oligocarboniphilum]|uniref:DUF411 domain-containing protein n=1 Tax=Undibacterium oligocarboniphilum TaxID=666702 RepID=A0A850QBD9_9BURK|nr:DUF411 domain-containing protein [Undibacterium oligocarboniphilum]MBC3868609.1 DUF411 domain-containing protein [Undibacterium oligocarboniphilum]NVO76589.1 DUF411 domain-containing protein [Undibacterium oligocarboniphilum]
MTSTDRRRPLLLGLLLLVTAVPYAVAANTSTAIEVWKGPNCGCCKDWIRHLEANGFTVKTFDIGNSDIRTKLGMPIRFGSCHTAKVGNYAIEGHVPARDIQRLLKERPDAIGLAVPAMPMGSPGMDGPEYQGRKDPFDVFLVKKDSQAVVFQSYR